MLPKNALEPLKIYEFEKYMNLNDNVVNMDMTNIENDMRKMIDLLLNLSKEAEKLGIKEKYEKRKEIDRLK